MQQVRGNSGAGRQTVQTFWPAVCAICVYVGAAVAGAIAGLAVAAGGLAVFGKAMGEAPPAQAHLLMVAGPLLGLLPVSLFALAASRHAALAAHAPPALGAWLLCALAGAAWSGTRALIP